MRIFTPADGLELYEVSLVLEAANPHCVIERVSRV